MSEIKIFNGGFVRLVDVYGSDQRIVDAARTSYLEGTKKTSTDESLIRYLVRNLHSSPLEMCEATYHLCLPLAISTQLIRHRTFNFNFESLRYSEAKKTCYLPEEKDITLQSTNNKQGGTNIQATLENILNPEDFVDDGFGLSDFYKDFKFSDVFKTITNLCHTYYTALVNSGIRREVCRMVLPVSEYTECYAKCDLNNLFKFFKLRLDNKAQLEMRIVAESMYQLLKPNFPISCKAFEDYILNATTFSQTELTCLRKLIMMSLSGFQSKKHTLYLSIVSDGSIIEKSFPNKRERQEFLDKLDKLFNF